MLEYNVYFINAGTKGKLVIITFYSVNYVTVNQNLHV
jgi:hypothetical protein